MKFILLVTCLSTIVDNTSAQFSVSKAGIFFAKEYSKERALYNAKTFLVHDVLGETSEVVKFEVDPLAAANSGELTTLVYKCESKNKEGLIMGFYGDRWNEAGVVFQSYAFKNLPTKAAIELLAKIESATKDNSKFLSADNDNYDIYLYIPGHIDPLIPEQADPSFR